MLAKRARYISSYNNCCQSRYIFIWIYIAYIAAYIVAASGQWNVLFVYVHVRGL